jgi:CCR4-NOT transcription complex subunit 6
MQQHVLSQSSPASSATQVISPHWQQQLLKCEVCSPCIYTPC